jgi:hypothetical protein
MHLSIEKYAGKNCSAYISTKKATNITHITWHYMHHLAYN